MCFTKDYKEKKRPEASENYVLIFTGVDKDDRVNKKMDWQFKTNTYPTLKILVHHLAY